uniref:Transmembrane protein n=1 Tax=Medicago truncatula TaxID=3880 RepID=I3TA29_MEDTR|nr:unknown [Medicago truncatula]
MLLIALFITCRKWILLVGQLGIDQHSSTLPLSYLEIYTSFFTLTP